MARTRTAFPLLIIIFGHAVSLKPAEWTSVSHADMEKGDWTPNIGKKRIALCRLCNIRCQIYKIWIERRWIDDCKSKYFRWIKWLNASYCESFTSAKALQLQRHIRHFIVAIEKKNVQSVEERCSSKSQPACVQREVIIFRGLISFLLAASRRMLLLLLHLQKVTDVAYRLKN